MSLRSTFREIFMADNRSVMDMLHDIDRKLNRLLGEYEMDLYDRIIAGVQALQAGDTTALSDHVKAIDSHLAQVDNEQLQLQGDDTASKTRLDAIEAGLGKIANAVGPATPPASTGGATGAIGPASGATVPTGTTGAASTGTGIADQTPGSAAPAAPAPVSGPGSETVGQVDTPKPAM